ncbi:MAG: alpha/beta hydrolase [Actinobacteria bacterium]|nr:alpha/beta hydrolase [Actinomycetota bacterium]
MESATAQEFRRWPGLVARRPRSGVDGPTLVFVHGAMDRGAGMAQLTRRFGDVPTMRYDRRGYGRAIGLGTGDLARHVDDLVGLVADRPVVLFGHSFGGLVVLGAAASGRLDVRAVITWEVPTPWIDRWPGWARVTIGGSSDPAGDTAEAFMCSTIGRDRWERLGPSTRGARRAEGASLIADLDPRLAEASPFDPAQIDVPCTFGVGTVGSTPYQAAAAWMADRVPNSKVEIVDGAGHDAPVAQAESVARLVTATLAASQGDTTIVEGRDAVTV